MLELTLACDVCHVSISLRSLSFHYLYQVQNDSVWSCLTCLTQMGRHHSVNVFVQVSLWGKKQKKMMLSSPFICFTCFTRWKKWIRKFLRQQKSFRQTSHPAPPVVDHYRAPDLGWLCDRPCVLYEWIAEIIISACFLIRAVSVFLHNQILSSRNRTADKMKRGDTVLRTRVEW